MAKFSDSRQTEAALCGTVVWEAPRRTDAHKPKTIKGPELFPCPLTERRPAHAIDTC